MRVYEGLEAFANHRGWRIEPAKLGYWTLDASVVGQQDGVPISVTFTPRQGWVSTKSTRESPLPVPFLITHEGVLSRLGHAIGIHDVEVGDRAFDDAFRLKTEDPDWLRRLLTPELRATLLRLHAQIQPNAYHWLHVRHDVVELGHYHMPGMPALLSEDVLAADIPIVVEVVKALDAARPH
jgi:hypothetical protein